MFTDQEVVGAVLAELKAVTGLSWEVWQTGGGCEAYGAALPSGESVMMADDGALIEWGETIHVSLGFFSADEMAAEDWRDCRELGGWGEGFEPLGFDQVLDFVRESFVLWGLAVEIAERCGVAVQGLDERRREYARDVLDITNRNLPDEFRRVLGIDEAQL
jgi:hypothetical protein